MVISFVASGPISLTIQNNNNAVGGRAIVPVVGVVHFLSGGYKALMLDANPYLPVRATEFPTPLCIE